MFTPICKWRVKHFYLNRLCVNLELLLHLNDIFGRYKQKLDLSLVLSIFANKRQFNFAVLFRIDSPEGLD